MLSPAPLVVTGLLVAGVALTPGGAPSAEDATVVAPAVVPVAYEAGIYPPVSGDTLSVMNMVNNALGAAGTLSRDAIAPGSESAADVAAAERLAYNMGGNTGQLQGYLYEQGVRQEVGQYDARVRAENAARDYATETWIESDDAISRSAW